MVIAASFTAIERFENSLSIVRPGEHGAQQVAAPLDEEDVKLELKR
jgi:hypothetical protein